MEDRLVLASGSLRRYEMLTRMGFDVDVVPADISENPLPGEAPSDHVLRLATAKARSIASLNPRRWVIGADTVVVINGTVLGKPHSREEALSMLSLLSGREHTVLTGFAICHLEKGKFAQGVAETEVKMKVLTPSEMEWYVSTQEPFDKAGAYAIQGIGSFMIESIRGSYSNVVGLPLCELIETLMGLGALVITERGWHLVNDDVSDQRELSKSMRTD